MSRFLVTGATGFIGRRLVARLVADFGPASVVCLAMPPANPLEAASRARFQELGLRSIEADLLKHPVCGVPPPPVSVIFHLAANIDTDASEDQLGVNHTGTRHLLDWLRPASNGTRILYASSVAVHDRDARPDAPISESSPLVPRTAYGQTKLQGEAVIRERASVDGYSWTILRLPTVYGPGQKPDGLFDKLIRMAREGRLAGRVNWPGRTSIVHVDDVADAMIDLAMRGDTAGEIYCVASDESLTVGELAQGIGNAVGRPIAPVNMPRPVWTMARSLVWNPAIQAIVPPAARLSFWRLSLIVSDGFWFDTAKFRRTYTKPLRNLEAGLVDTLASRDGTYPSRSG